MCSDALGGVTRNRRLPPLRPITLRFWFVDVSSERTQPNGINYFAPVH